MREKIYQLLMELRLRGMANVLDQELSRAEKNGTPVSEVIYRILMEEHAYRQERSLNYRLKQARIPWDWTLKTFPFDGSSGKSVGEFRFGEFAHRQK